MVKQNEKSAEKIKQYKDLSPEHYGILSYDIEDLIKLLPKLCKDLNLLWELLLENYGQECFTPMIAAKYPDQFNVDKDKTVKFLGEI